MRASSKRSHVSLSRFHFRHSSQVKQNKKLKNFMEQIRNRYFVFQNFKALKCPYSGLGRGFLTWEKPLRFSGLISFLLLQTPSYSQVSDTWPEELGRTTPGSPGARPGTERTRPAGSGPNPGIVPPYKKENNSSKPPVASPQGTTPPRKNAGPLRFIFKAASSQLLASAQSTSVLKQNKSIFFFFYF